MRYIADSEGYVKEVSFGADIACGDQDCTEYTGGVPDGYTSLEAWYIAEVEKLYRWQIIDGQLTLDSSAVAPTDGSNLAAYDKHHIHYQNTADSVWTIAHNLDKFPAVTVVDSAGTEVVGDVKYLDINTVELTFIGAFSGKAYLN